MTIKCTDLVFNWLNAFKRTSPAPEHALIGECRRAILRSFLDQMGEDKFKELSEANQIAFCKSVGITPPVKTVAASYKPSSPETWAKVEPVQMNRAEYPEPEGDFAETNPIETFRRQALEKRQARWKIEKAADMKGEYWEAVAAYYPDKTFLMLHQGVIKPDMQEAFDSQHTEAHMHLEAAPLIGKLSDVRGQAAKQFQGISPNDLTIRIVTKKDSL